MNTSQPTLTTERLILRPFTLADAERVQELAGAREIADTTGNIPHPYPDDAAAEWINGQRQEYESGKGMTFAITLRNDWTLIGAIGIHPDKEHHRAEIGYWIGLPYWNCGYCTEAARAVIAFGFQTLNLNRIYANHLTRNPASG